MVVTLLGLVGLAGPGPPAAPAAPEVPQAAAPSGEETPSGETGAASPGARAVLEGKPMNVNRATVDDLQLLPRIGPALADRIARDRRARGPFTSLEDLARVRGIGPATVAGLRDLATAGKAEKNNENGGS